jgi:hypothetical protein
MTTLKVMSIIGLVWYALLLFCILSMETTDVEEALGYGLLVIIYAIPYSIVGLVQANKQKKKNAE